MATKTISTKRDEMRTILEYMGGNLDDAKRRLDQLWRLHDAEFGEDGEYLRDGNFTDAGRKRLRELLDSGMRNMEIAEFFGVTDSAIAYQRKRWNQLDAARLVR